MLTLTQHQAIFAHRKQGHLSSIGQVISVEKWAEVRVLFHREGLSQRAIARRLEISRDTVTCPHGEERGPRRCALCRSVSAGSEVPPAPAARVPVSNPFDEFHAHLSFVSRIQAQFSLPYRDPGPINGWTRTNVSAMLTLRPARLLDKDGKPYDVYPYGAIPRLLLTWLVTQVKQTGERSI